MRVFVTGATGFIGSRIVRNLLADGHRVLGLVRSDDKAAALAATGAEVHHGSLYDPDSLKSGAAAADAVIHTAFNHDFSRFQENCETDRRVIEALGSVLAGSDRPLLITSGTGIASTEPGGIATEDAPTVSSAQIPRAASEEAARAVADQGVRVSVLRLPQVHDPARQGLVSYLVDTAREKGVVGYAGDGRSRWPAAHVDDVARLYCLALKKAAPYAVYNAVAEEGVAMRDIAEVLGERLGLPVQSIAPADLEAWFGWLATFAALDMPASSALTRQRLGWEPTGPTLIEDLKRFQPAGT